MFSERESFVNSKNIPKTWAIILEGKRGKRERGEGEKISDQTESNWMIIKCLGKENLPMKNQHWRKIKMKKDKRRTKEETKNKKYEKKVTEESLRKAHEERTKKIEWTEREKTRKKLEIWTEDKVKKWKYRKGK